MDGPILVTGASGFVGVHLIRRMRRDGAAVRALVRHGSDVRPLEALGAELARGDLTQPSSLARAVDGCAAVVHLGGAADVTDADVNRRVNVDGSESLGRACARAGVRRVLFFSTNCALRELRDAYGETKRLAEQALQACDLDLRIFRPAMIYGEGSREWATFVTAVARLPWVPVPGRGQHLLRPVFVDDVLEAVARALATDGLEGRAYDILGPTASRFDELVDAVAARIGRHRRILPLPMGACMTGVRALGRVWAHPPVTPDQVLAFAQDTRGDLAPAASDLGWRPRPLEEGLDVLFARCDWRRMGTPPV